MGVATAQRCPVSLRWAMGGEGSQPEDQLEDVHIRGNDPTTPADNGMLLTVG